MNEEGKYPKAKELMAVPDIFEYSSSHYIGDK